MSTDVTERLKILMHRHQLNASQLAYKLGVQPSGISHILSGRNKPSLDFLVRMADQFDDVDLNWLITGVRHGNKKVTTVEAPSVEAVEGKIEKVTPVTTRNSQQELPSTNETEEKKVVKVILFYEDGTFSEHRS